MPSEGWRIDITWRGAGLKRTRRGRFVQHRKTPANPGHGAGNGKVDGEDIEMKNLLQEVAVFVLLFMVAVGLTAAGFLVFSVMEQRMQLRAAPLTVPFVRPPAHLEPCK